MKTGVNIKLVVAGACALLLLSAQSIRAQQSNVQLKVICWNVLSFEGVGKAYNFNIGPFVEMFKYYDPDIICMQEFETDNYDVTYPASLEAVEKLTELASRLGMYPYFGWSYDKKDHPSHAGKGGYYGNAILSKYPIVKAHSEQLYFVGWNNWQQYGSDQRSFEYIDILVPTDSNPAGEKVRIINTHLDHIMDQNTQAQEIVQKGFDNNIPTLFMGDMNQVGGTSTITTIRAKCDDVGVNSIDWIFSFPKGSWQVDNFTVLRQPADNQTPSATEYPDLNRLSDHRPLLTTVTLK